MTILEVVSFMIGVFIVVMPLLGVLRDWWIRPRAVGPVLPEGSPGGGGRTRPRADEPSSSGPHARFRPLPPDPVVPPAARRPAAGLAGVRDGLTGVSLQAARGLHRCRRCEVHYHAESVAVLRAENGGRCVNGCDASDLHPCDVVGVRGTVRHPPVTVSVEDVRARVGQWVVFEGTCLSVLQSQRGRHVAVLFEQRSWADGFKMIVPGCDVERVGGVQFLAALEGRRLRIRGLVLAHPVYGPEMIIDDPAMILEVT